MKSKISKYYVIYKDGSKYYMELDKMSVVKTRACIEKNAREFGQEVAAIKVIAADGSLNFLK